MSTLSIDTLKKALDKFRQEPLNRFRVKLMRKQAERLRHFLASPTEIDLATFHREIWSFNASVWLDVSPIGQWNPILEDSVPNANKLSLLERELDEGKLAIWGQSIWTPTHNTYAPHLNNESTKRHYIYNTLNILNNFEIAPLDKALEIATIEGFSVEIASGLVMVFHPTEFMYYAYPAVEVISQLGTHYIDSLNTPYEFKTNSLEPFQQSIQVLQKILPVDDLIELNHFLAWVSQHLEPQFENIWENITHQGLHITKSMLRRYHLSLKTRGFVILSGISGTGKTWLADQYAKAVKAESLIVPVAPNWASNEDLLGYFNPLTETYQDTPFSQFLRRAAAEYEQKSGIAQTYHLILDEMNLARVEYYFAKFLSAMEIRARDGIATIELAPGESVILPPNLYFIGTVNIDETTHSFADKIYDRAQLIELTVSRAMLINYLDQEFDNYEEAAQVLIQIWDAVHEVAPFAFRILTEIKAYFDEAAKLEVSWQEALDEQLLQKILPKMKGTDWRLGKVLEEVINIANTHHFPLTLEKAQTMYDDFMQHGIATYF